jgi:hypothetical protein
MMKSGKTTVAALYAKFLESLSVVKKGKCIGGTGICLARAPGFRDDFISEAERAAGPKERMVKPPEQTLGPVDQPVMNSDTCDRWLS